MYIWNRVLEKLTVLCILFFFGATAASVPQPSHSRGFYIIHDDAPQSVGLLWTSVQLVAETSTWQHTTLTTNRYPSHGGIRTHNLSRRAAADLRLRPRGHWDRRTLHKRHGMLDKVGQHQLSWNDLFHRLNPQHTRLPQTPLPLVPVTSIDELSWRYSHASHNGFTGSTQSHPLRNVWAGMTAFPFWQSLMCWKEQELSCRKHIWSTNPCNKM